MLPQMIRSMSRFATRLAAAAAVVVLAACGPSSPASGTPTAEAVSAASVTPSPSLAPSEPFAVSQVTLRGPGGEALEVPVYVAAAPQERARGLMEREDLPDGTGMLFVFPADHRGAFYMYRTPLPLSIAFADSQGRIVALLDMEPCTSPDADACERYDPGVSYRSALEVEQGFLDAHGVSTDWRLDAP